MDGRYVNLTHIPAAGMRIAKYHITVYDWCDVGKESLSVTLVVNAYLKINFFELSPVLNKNLNSKKNLSLNFSLEIKNSESAELFQTFLSSSLKFGLEFRNSKKTFLNFCWSFPNFFELSSKLICIHPQVISSQCKTQFKKNSKSFKN